MSPDHEAAVARCGVARGMRLVASALRGVVEAGEAELRDWKYSEAQRVVTASRVEYTKELVGIVDELVTGYDNLSAVTEEERRELDGEASITVRAFMEFSGKHIRARLSS